MNKTIISQEKIVAMKAKDSFRSQTLGTILANIKQHEVDKRVEVDDQTLISILNRMAKQRQESIDQFSKANRQDLVDIEVKELEIIKEFLPASASDEEIDKVISDAIALAGSASVKNMGTIMKHVKTELNGKADMGRVNQLVKSRLS